MARRKNGEFDSRTKEHAFRKAGGKDQITSEPLGDYPEVDHIIPLAWAAVNAPDIPLQYLKSSDNARVLNRETHKNRHRELDEQEIWVLVNFFREIQKELL